MDILQWIETYRPGTIINSEEYVEVRHDSGETSTIWLRSEPKGDSSSPPHLQDIYGKYDGMSLFSSTFVIASRFEDKRKRDVVLTRSLDSMASQATVDGAKFPPSVIPFMKESGMGYYGVDRESGRLAHWDTLSNELSFRNSGLEFVFIDWVSAVE